MFAPKSLYVKLWKLPCIQKVLEIFRRFFGVFLNVSYLPRSCTPVEAGVHPATGFVPNWLGDIDCPPELVAAG